MAKNEYILKIKQRYEPKNGGILLCSAASLALVLGLGMLPLKSVLRLNPFLPKKKS